MSVYRASEQSKRGAQDVQTLSLSLRELTTSITTATQLTIVYAGIQLPRDLNSFGCGTSVELTYPYKHDNVVTFFLQAADGECQGQATVDFSPFINSTQTTIENISIQLLPSLATLMVSASTGHTEAKSITIRTLYSRPTITTRSAESSPQTPPPQHKKQNQRTPAPKERTMSRERSRELARERSRELSCGIYDDCGALAAVTLSDLSSTPAPPVPGEAPSDLCTLKMIITEGSCVSLNESNGKLYCEIHDSALGTLASTTKVPIAESFSWNETFFFDVKKNSNLKLLFYCGSECFGVGNVSLPSCSETLEESVEIRRNTGTFGATTINVACQWEPNSPSKAKSFESLKSSDSGQRCASSWLQQQQCLPSVNSTKKGESEPLHINIKSATRISRGAFEIPNMACHLSLSGRSIEASTTELQNHPLDIPYNNEATLYVILVDLSCFPIEIIGGTKIDLTALQSYGSSAWEINNLPIVDGSGSVVAGVSLSLSLSPTDAGFERMGTLGTMERGCSGSFSRLGSGREFIRQPSLKREASVKSQPKYLRIDKIGVLNCSSFERLIDLRSCHMLLEVLEGSTVSCRAELPAFSFELGVLAFVSGRELDYNGEMYLRCAVTSATNGVLAKTKIDLKKYLEFGMVSKQLSMCGARNGALEAVLDVRLSFLKEQTPVDVTTIGATIMGSSVCGNRSYARSGMWWDSLFSKPSVNFTPQFVINPLALELTTEETLPSEVSIELVTSENADTISNKSLEWNQISGQTWTTKLASDASVPFRFDGNDGQLEIRVSIPFGDQRVEIGSIEMDSSKLVQEINDEDDIMTNSPHLEKRFELTPCTASGARGVLVFSVVPHGAMPDGVSCSWSDASPIRF